MQDRARLVIVGAGIVGASAAYQLGRLGWRDIVVVEQGPLFHTGGSTSHAPGGLALITSSRMLTEFAKYAVSLYATLSVDGRPGARLVGSLELARSAARWNEIKRRSGWGKSFGVEHHLLGPAECGKLVPILDQRKIIGGLLTPGAGPSAPVVISEALARAAIAEGAAVFHGGTRVTGIETAHGRVKAVITDRGRIASDHVLLCAGIWGPLIGRMAGIAVPLQPMQHQYARVGPVPELAALGLELGMPGIRLHDHDIYCRQYGDLWGIGNYDHEPLPVEPEDIAAGPGEPSKMAFTPDHFSAARAAADEVFPAIKGAPIVDAFNGMFSFTPDGFPILGPSAALDGLWLAEAVWIMHAAGAAKAVAEWMTHGTPGLDVREADANRFHRHALTRAYIRKRGEEQYRTVHAIIHPAEPAAAPRGLRRTPLHARYEGQGAVFFEAGGWERPQWCEANARLLEFAAVPARTGWAAQYWSPVQAAEHRATRAAASLYDMSTFSKLDIEGKDALALVDTLCTNRMDVAVGRAVYTALLNEAGGILTDLTVVRLGARKFRMISGTAGAARDGVWIRGVAARRGCEATITDLSSGLAVVGLWGPRARDILAAASEGDVGNDGLPYYTAREIVVASAPALALRVSYVGELGFELYTPSEYALGIWDRLWEIGAPLGLVAAGFGAMDSLRIEKGYRRSGADIDADHDPFEAGLGFVVDLDKGEFIGRQALVRKDARNPRRKLACMTLERADAVVLGREPILLDGQVLGYVTSANYGYSLGKFIAYGYLPAERASQGQRVEIEYFGERLPGVVARSPLFDPKGSRLRG
ncbi:MAG: GcvT family protein [Pseudomonadota bacterium]